MDDETTTAPVTAPEADPATPPNEPAQTGEGKGKGKGPVPYERFAEVNTQRQALAREIEQLKGQLVTATTDAEMKIAAATTEQTRLAGELTAREKELGDERAARLRLEVAYEHGVPFDLADRLKGATREELVADVAKVAPHIKQKGHGVPPPPRTPQGGATSLKGMTPAQIRENADRLWGQSKSGS